MTFSPLTRRVACEVSPLRPCAGPRELLRRRDARPRAPPFQPRPQSLAVLSPSRTRTQAPHRQRPAPAASVRPFPDVRPSRRACRRFAAAPSPVVHRCPPAWPGRDLPTRAHNQWSTPVPKCQHFAWRRQSRASNHVASSSSQREFWSGPVSSFKVTLRIVSVALLEKTVVSRCGVLRKQREEQAAARRASVRVQVARADGGEAPGCYRCRSVGLPKSTSSSAPFPSHEAPNAHAETHSRSARPAAAIPPTA